MAHLLSVPKIDLADRATFQLNQRFEAPDETLGVPMYNNDRAADADEEEMLEGATPETQRSGLELGGDEGGSNPQEQIDLPRQCSRTMNRETLPPDRSDLKLEPAEVRSSFGDPNQDISANETAPEEKRNTGPTAHAETVTELQKGGYLVSEGANRRLEGSSSCLPTDERAEDKEPTSANGIQIPKTGAALVEIFDQSVSSQSLVESVERALVGDATPSSASIELRSLVIRHCQVPSLLPVASLTGHLGGMSSLELDGCTEMALTGLERVLANSPCLRALTIRRCGFSKLPPLVSESIDLLDVSGNSLRDTTGIETLCHLKTLNLAWNNICSLDGLRPLVPLGANGLRELDLTGNPVQNKPRCARFYAKVKAQRGRQPFVFDTSNVLVCCTVDGFV